MPTTWNTIYLGVLPIIDPTEGNDIAENASLLAGTTIGSAEDRLFFDVVSVATTNVGGSPGRLEQDNSVAGDMLTYDLGGGSVTTTFDAVVEYNATITYDDGSTWTGVVNIVQDSLGNSFLVPNTANNAAQQALIAGPIQSLTINSVSSSTNAGLAANRQTTNFLTCFAAGTKVLTPSGEVAVEALQPGDLVITLDHGAQALRWIGRTATLGQGDHAPIRFGPGALGEGPALLVSPQHRMHLTGAAAELLFGEAEVLLAAKHLLGQPGVSQAPCGAITYFHLMFDQHELVLAEGRWSESFFPGDMLEQGDPAARAEILALFPDLRRPQGGYGATARRVLRGPEARALLAPPQKITLAA